MGVRGGVLAALFVAVFWGQLRFIPPFGNLVDAWIHDADWSHGSLIPVFSAYLIYLRWDRLRGCRPRLAWLGLPIMLLGLAFYAAALGWVIPFGYARPCALMVTLLGVLVFLWGVPAMYYLWLPWIYLFFAIPLPQRIYFLLTDPLRRMAATVASTVLSLRPGLHVERVGSNIEFLWQGQEGVIGVADACSGMRSTVTLCALGVAVACMSDRPLWQRLILVAACVPIATFCNFVRVTITCWLHIFVDPKYAEGTYHMLLGLLIIMFAFGIFTGVGWILSRLYVEEEVSESEAEL
jgi:exosortase